MLADFLRLETPPLLFIDDAVDSEREIAFELRHVGVGLLHLFSNRLVDSFSFLHLILESLLELLNQLAHDI